MDIVYAGAISNTSNIWYIPIQVPKFLSGRLPKNMQNSLSDKWLSKQNAYLIINNMIYAR